MPQPRNAHARSFHRFRHARPELRDFADNLVPGDQRQYRFVQLSINDMQISPADPARQNPDQNLSEAGFRPWQFKALQRRICLLQHHGVHC